MSSQVKRTTCTDCTVDLENYATIRLCPLHRAAGQLLEALESVTQRLDELLDFYEPLHKTRVHDLEMEMRGGSRIQVKQARAVIKEARG